MTNIFNELAPTDGGSEDTWGAELLDILESDEDFTNRLQGLLVISSPVDAQDEYVTFHSRFPFTIKRIAYQCLPTGTATLAVKINGVDVGSLGSISATSTKQTTDATAPNTVSATNAVTVTPTATAGGVERIVIAVWGDRTAAGTAV